MDNKLLFSLDKKDFEFQTFCSGGKGGQHQNKTESGVRCIHKESGSVGECREERSQWENKKRAFRRCVETKEFKKWHKLEVCRIMGKYSSIEDMVKIQLENELKNIKIEVQDENGKWVDYHG